MTTSNTSPISRFTAQAAAPLHAVELVEDTIDDVGLLRLRATKAIDATDPYMTGHFPDFTIYPGVFILETIAQAVTASLGEPVRIVRVRSMRFIAPLCAEDVLIVDCLVRALQKPGEWSVDASCSRLDGTDSARIKLDVQAERRDDASVR